MRNVKALHRPGPDQVPGEDDEEQLFADEEDAYDDLPRVLCPGCARPVALEEPGGAVPQHAVCPSPFDPFGMAVCPGSGEEADDGVVPLPVTPLAVEPVALAALPESLHWRLQPFSHAVRHATRPAVVTLRQAA
ncbi:hypothetical protein [Streptomyces avicenniae]|uniref:hypothetical protein n=1 Tax=Streptomyces avicenniae TaxID=500153 RepID=UPI00167CEE0F|nr:hypothetical protein [Streptomyces avicenniae]